MFSSSGSWIIQAWGKGNEDQSIQTCEEKYFSQDNSGVKKTKQEITIKYQRMRKKDKSHQTPTLEKRKIGKREVTLHPQDYRSGKKKMKTHPIPTCAKKLLRKVDAIVK